MSLNGSRTESIVKFELSGCLHSHPYYNISKKYVVYTYEHPVRRSDFNVYIYLLSVRPDELIPNHPTTSYIYIYDKYDSRPC